MQAMIPELRAPRGIPPPPARQSHPADRISPVNHSTDPRRTDNSDRDRGLRTRSSCAAPMTLVHRRAYDSPMPRIAPVVPPESSLLCEGCGYVLDGLPA